MREQWEQFLSPTMLWTHLQGENDSQKAKNPIHLPPWSCTIGVCLDATLEASCGYASGPETLECQTWDTMPETRHASMLFALHTTVSGSVPVERVFP